MSLGKWRSNVDVAVKTLKPGQMSVEAFLEEARIMHKLRHRKLVQLMGVCTLKEPVYIITELMVHGALLDFLRNDAGRSVKLKEMIDIATQVTIIMIDIAAQLTVIMIDNATQVTIIMIDIATQVTSIMIDIATQVTSIIIDIATQITIYYD